MTKPISIFSGTSGINTKLDPTRLRFNPKTGISDFASGVNIDIDDSGRPFRRDGTTATARTETNWKNLFGCGAYGLGTKGNALCVLEADMSYTAIRNVAEGARMSFVRDTDGTQEIVYYADGYEIGRIIKKLSYSWTVGTYTGPETRKTFYAPPTGHIIEIRNLRMFIAEGNILWYSEPGAFNLYRLAANYFGFPSRLKMVQAVDGGLWVSDSESIYFLGGEIAPTLQEMPIQRKKADCPAREGSAVKVPASRIGLDGLSGIVVVFTTDEGVCVGSVDGQLINLTERKIDIPSGLTGAGFYKDGKYICTLD